MLRRRGKFSGKLEGAGERSRYRLITWWQQVAATRCHQLADNLHPIMRVDVQRSTKCSVIFASFRTQPESTNRHCCRCCSFRRYSNISKPCFASCCTLNSIAFLAVSREEDKLVIAWQLWLEMIMKEKLNIQLRCFSNTSCGLYVSYVLPHVNYKAKSHLNP